MNLEQDSSTKIVRPLFGDENGVILMVTLIFVGILALLGATATLITTTDTKISGNYKASKKALYVAEAGAHEARERLRAGATGEIIDAHTDKYQWTVYIGTDSKSQKRGYDSTNSMHNRVASLQTDPEPMDYTVAITHQLDTTDPTKVLYWGDDDNDGEWTRNTTTGENIYLITSYGTAEGSTKTVQLEVTRVPPITVKAALYSGASASIKGNVAINGNDSCGDGSYDKPGIATPEPTSSPVSFIGNAESTGDPESEDPTNVKYAEDPAMVVQSMADFLKKSADFLYNVSIDTLYTASDTPGPADGWGVPDLTVNPSADPPTPNCDSYNLVHYDADGTSTIKLSGQVSGCGILVVEGDLEITGGFEWYGTVIVTGALRFSGGGAGNNIMGAVITGGTADGDVLTGNVTINYCSTATEDENEKHSLLILSWKEVLAE